MSILQKSSSAKDRQLVDWFQVIQRGYIKLPRFQRYEAWDRGRITSFLSTIINNLPVGVTLVLEVRGEEKFISRYITTAKPSEVSTVIEHLLDGQQRLTAFWRSMHNNYERETYYIYLPQFDQRNPKISDVVRVYCQPRWNRKNGVRYPLWADIPDECLWRGFVPIDLLCPGNKPGRIDNWTNDAMHPHKPNKEDQNAFTKLEKFNEEKDRLKQEINSLRTRVNFFNLPYLSLPSDTPKDVALQVFINMNTNSKPLSLYDIIVAEVESVTSESLHDLVNQLINNCPKAKHFGDISNLILATSALMQERTPNSRGMLEMDKKSMLNNWVKLERGLERMVELLENQRIFDFARLPTNAVLAVIAASYKSIPEHGDFVAKAEKLLRAYLWSSFFTDRYENSAPTRAYADFKGAKNKHRGIKDFLEIRDYDERDLTEIPVLNRNEHDLADLDAITNAGWPKNVGILARGILAVSNYFGARDFADDKEVSYESIQNREYHHIFPSSLLDDANLGSEYALNCALLTWKTNRIIGRKDPLEYLRERVEWADEEIVSSRLKTHLVSYKLLSKARYEKQTDDKFRAKLKSDFDKFIQIRAQLIQRAMIRLTKGEQPSLESIWLES